MPVVAVVVRFGDICCCCRSEMDRPRLPTLVYKFVQKAVHVIVQSRLGGERIRTNCNRNGNDWFNVDIPDIADVADQTKKCLDQLGGELPDGDDSDSAKKSFTITSNWRLCCEVSLKTTEGETMVLEYWFVTNEVLDPTSPPSPSKAAAPSNAIYDIYNKMSLMLKSLITLSRATPAYKISAGQSAESYVVCYRVYQSDFSFENVINSKSKEAKHYTSEIKLGTICSKLNRLTVSLAYRTDMVSCSAQSTDETSNEADLMPVKNDHFNNAEPSSHILKPLVEAPTKPLMAAFASSPSSAFRLVRLVALINILMLAEFVGDPLPQLPENAFSRLLITQDESVTDGADKSENDDAVPSSHCETKPISIPEPQVRKKLPDLSTSPGVGCSGDSGESDFVFVDLKAPFASQDQSELGSFFNGPSPAFSNSGDLTEELGDITSQLAMLESNIVQWDSFVDSICCQPEESKLESV